MKVGIKQKKEDFMFSVGTINAVGAGQESRYEVQETTVTPKPEPQSNQFSFENMVVPPAISEKGAEDWFVEQVRPGSISEYELANNARAAGGATRTRTRASSGCSVVAVGGSHTRMPTDESLAAIGTFFGMTFSILGSVLEAWSSHSSDSYRSNWSAMWNDSAGMR